jgi:hypothetical protein
LLFPSSVSYISSHVPINLINVAVGVAVILFDGTNMLSIDTLALLPNCSLLKTPLRLNLKRLLFLYGVVFLKELLYLL